MTTSMVRRSRCPTEDASVMTAAMGAKNGVGRPMTSCATNQASAAATPAWTASAHAAEALPGVGQARARPIPQLGEGRPRLPLALSLRHAIPP